jgi:hypothetical protein
MMLINIVDPMLDRRPRANGTEWPPFDVKNQRYMVFERQPRVTNTQFTQKELELSADWYDIYHTKSDYEHPSMTELLGLGPKKQLLSTMDDGSYDVPATNAGHHGAGGHYPSLPHHYGYKIPQHQQSGFYNERPFVGYGAPRGGHRGPLKSHNQYGDWSTWSSSGSGDGATWWAT